MPEFILDIGSTEGARAFNALDEFTRGYIEAAFFTSTGDAGDDELESASVAEIAPESLVAIVLDCAAWQAANATLLDHAYHRDYSAEQAGRDYWLTRNGHGAGFWDRDELMKYELGDKLSAACRGSNVDVYRGDDGQIYFT